MCLQTMKRLWDAHGSPFVAALLGGVRRIARAGKRDPAVLRSAQFVSLLLIEHRELGIPVLSELTRLSRAACQAVRLGACWMLSLCLQQIPGDFELSATLCDGISASLVSRLRDRASTVREMAVEGLARLQDPEAEECQAIAGLARLVASDPAVSVRKKALQALVVAEGSLPQVLARTRDGCAEMRVLAFEVLERKVRAGDLTREQRTALVGTGLNDRDPRVNEGCRRMVRYNWLRAVHGDFLGLLALLRLEGREATVELLLRNLFRMDLLPESTAFIAAIITAVQGEAEQRENMANQVWGARPDDDDDENDDEQVATDDRSMMAESEIIQLPQALLWRMWIEEAAQRRNDEALELLLPSSPCMRLLLQRREVREQPLVGKQVLMIAHFVIQSTDVCGRGIISSELGQCLQDVAVDLELVPLCMKRIHEIHPRPGDFLRCIDESLIELREPIDIYSSPDAAEAIAEETEQFNRLVDELERLQHALALASGSGDGGLEEEVETIQRLIDGMIQEEEERIQFFNLVEHRSLKIMGAAVFLSPRSAVQSGQMAALIDTVVRPALRCPGHPQIFVAGLACAAQLSLLTLGFATEFFAVFLRYLSEESLLDEEGSPLQERDQAAVRLACLQGVLDVLAAHGLGPFLSEGGAGPVAYDALMPRLVRLMRSEVRGIRTTAVEGLARLFLLGRVTSGRLLTPLLIQYFNPRTEDDGRLRQCLALFLQAFAARSSAAKLLLCEALGDLVLAIRAARGSGTLAALSLPLIVRTIAGLTEIPRGEAVRAAGQTPHALIAAEVLELIVEDGPHIPRNPLCSVLKWLHQLRGVDAGTLDALGDMAQRASRNTRAPFKKSLDVFIAYLKDCK